MRLGTAGNFVILAKAAVSTTGTTAVVGDIGLSPAAASYITGFSLIADSTNTFSTSSLVTGNVYAADYAPPTPANMTTAISNMETAFTDAAGRTSPDFTELGAGDISGMTLVPGLYKWGTGVLITSGVTLSGGANDVWIFQIAGNLTVSNSAMGYHDRRAAQERILAGFRPRDTGNGGRLQGYYIESNADFSEYRRSDERPGVGADCGNIGC